MNQRTHIALAIAFTFSLLAVPAWAQKSKDDDAPKRPKIARQGDDYYQGKEYSKAIAIYRKAYGKVKSRTEKAEISYRLGECYRYTAQYKAAEAQYRRAIKAGYTQPEAYLGVAEMLKYQVKYSDALVAYEDMAKVFPSDERAKQGIESSKQALAWLSAVTRYQVGPVSDLNTKAHEYGLAFDGRQGTHEELLFSSTREGGIGKRKDGWTGQQFADIYTTKRLNADGSARGGKKGKGAAKVDPTAARAQKFSAPELLPEPVNTMDHEGSPAFDGKRRSLYFTRCMDVKRAQLGCAIYVTRRAGQTWQDPTPVVLTQDSSRSVGHPSINDDETLLYFAGDLQGTLGGKDIWLATYDKRKRTWANPVNLGALVNTKGDELFPFIHDDGYLYFSSDGQPGMGGYDLFRVKVGEDGLPTGEAENLKAPLNSPGDDFNIILRPGGLRDGYFVSNREGGTGGDDIWSIYEVPLKYGLRGTLKSEKDQSPLANATVKISGSDGFTGTVMTDKLGRFELIDDKLAADVNYSFAFEKKKFLNGGAKSNTMGLTLDKYVFSESENVFRYTMDVAATMAPIEYPVILPELYFALAKWDLNDKSRSALDTVFRTLVLNPNIVIELRSHTDYRDADDKNQALSQKRADTCVKYLISKGIDPARLVSIGMGESQPFEIPQNYKGMGKELFPAGTVLTEASIRKMPASQQEVANQINRRTDFRVIRDDYTPPVDTAALAEEAADKAKNAEPAKPVKGEVYTVGEKESFATVCRNANVGITDLRKLNGGLRGVRLEPGMILKVTPNGDYADFDAKHRQVNLGETWKTLAKDLGMKEKELKELNPEWTKVDPPVGTYIRTK